MWWPRKCSPITGNNKDILALPLRPLYSCISLLSFLLFLRDPYFNCPRMPVILPVSYLLLPVTNLAARVCTLSNSSWRTTPGGSQTELPYSRTGRTNPSLAASFTSWGQECKFRLRNPRVLLMLVQTLLTCSQWRLNELCRWCCSYKLDKRAHSWDYGTYHSGIRAVSPEPSLFAHIKYGSRRRIRPKIRHLALLDGCARAFEEWVYGGRKVS